MGVVSFLNLSFVKSTRSWIDCHRHTGNLIGAWFAFKTKQESITYHYTCHLRGIGVKDEGVRLLRQMGNVDFRPMDKTDQCCGFGGTFAVKYPAISGAIVEDKVNCIAATGAQTLVCNDAGCTMNISGMCHRQGKDTRVKHIAELMAEAMGIDVTGW